MANKKRGPSRAFGGPAETPAPGSTNSPGKRPVNWNLIALFLIISIGGTYLAIAMRPPLELPTYTYRKLNEYPHDKTAFTQGLVEDSGFLWESTGLYGESTIRKVDLESGEVLAQKSLDEKYFGEGLAILNDRLYQLTWKAGICFVYDRELNEVGQFKYDGQGWGLTTDGTHLILSDGTPELRFFNPETFEEVRSVWVRLGKRRVGRLNELEMFGTGGKLYANTFESDLVYEIDPKTGYVTAVIDLTGLWPRRERPRGGVLNGIAVNPKTNKMLVTGKYCPRIFEIQLELIENR